MDSVLTDSEQLLVEQFYNNETMRETIKKILLFVLYNNGTVQKGKESDSLRNAAFGLIANDMDGKLTNEQIGADLRALWEGIKLVENAFNAMSVYKIEEQKEGRKPIDSR